MDTSNTQLGIKPEQACHECSKWKLRYWRQKAETHRVASLLPDVQLQKVVNKETLKFRRPARDFISLGITDENDAPVFPGCNLLDKNSDHYVLADFYIRSTCDPSSLKADGKADILCLLGTPSLITGVLENIRHVVPFNGKLEGFRISSKGGE